MPVQKKDVTKMFQAGSSKIDTIWDYFVTPNEKSKI